MTSSQSFNQVKVICLGEALVDRLGLPGIDFGSNNSFQDFLGGAPANVACGLARLGINVSFIGRVGNDQIGNNFSELMTQREINLDFLQIDSIRPSRVVLVKRDINGDRSFEGFYGDVGHGFADQALDLPCLKESLNLLKSGIEWLVLGTIPLAKETSKESLLWIVQEAIKHDVRIALDVNWRPTFWDENSNPSIGPDDKVLTSVSPLIEKASLLKLSKEEAFWFFNIDNPEEISKSLPQRPDVVITNGKYPIKWFFDGILGETEIAANFKVVDTTGAGDAFMAGLLYKIISIDLIPRSNKEINEIIRFASSCGALVCQGKGAIDPQPTLQQVNSFLASTKTLGE